MDRKLISVALIASALVLVSMVSVGLSYSSVYQTDNTCTITCTYGYGETNVAKVGVSGSDLTFSPGDKILYVTYTDTQKTGEAYLYFTLSNIPAELVGKVWNVDILTVTNNKTIPSEVVDPYQSGSTVIKDDGSGKGTATIYGFYFDMNGVNDRYLAISSNIVGSEITKSGLQLTIKAIREA